MKKVLIATGFAVLAFASVAGAQGYMFNANLTVGSTGADVVALQDRVMAAGYTIPAIASGAAAKGYFGAQTAAAVKLYQASRGIPNTGFVGPLTRAALNSNSSVVTSNPGFVCPPGYQCIAPGSGTATNPTNNTGTITTPGVEGTLAATQSSAGISSTVYEGQSMAPVLGIELKAKNSDISVQRIKLDLGTATTIYNKIYSKIYVTEGGNVLASSDLNSSTVIKDGSNYYITVAGFNLLVPKNGSKTIVIKADVRASIDSTDLSSNYTILCVSTNCIRGVDGAGIDQYAGTSAITKTMNVDAELASSATLAVSTNTGTPKAADVVASMDSSEDSYGQLTVLGIDFKAEKDDVTLTDLVVDITKAGTGGATASTTVYLFEGSTEIDNATYSSGSATFSDIDVLIPVNTTKTLWVKIDIAGANGTVSQIAADVDTADVTAENSLGDSLTESGSATGETMYVRNVGPVFTLVSKSIVKSATASQSDVSTSTGEATFNLKIKAVGGDIHFGTVASATPMVGTSTTYFKLYKDGAEVTGASAVLASTTSYDTPSSGVSTSGLTNSFILQENNEITIPVSIRFEGRLLTGALVTGGSYSIGLEGIKWNTSTSNFMAGKTDWRTSTISLP